MNAVSRHLPPRPKPVPNAPGLFAFADPQRGSGAVNSWLRGQPGGGRRSRHRVRPRGVDGASGRRERRLPGAIGSAPA